MFKPIRAMVGSAEAARPRRSHLNQTRVLLTKSLHNFGLRAAQMQYLSLGSVGLCIALWIRAKTVDEDERGNAERRALFVGLWPPTIWLIGDSLERLE